MTKIMLVEDDKSLREIYGVRLLAEGYDIVSAGDGEEALAIAIKEKPQLIISDVMMPKVSGYDMLDILRSTTETKNIRVIMMTALSSEEQRQRAESLGADRYLVKSQVGIEDVVRVVHEVLEDTPGTMAAKQDPPTQPTNPSPTPQPQGPITPQNPPVVPAPAKPPAAPTPTPAPAPPMPPTPEPAPVQPPKVTAPPSTAPKPASLKDRVLQPLNDPMTSQVNLNDLLDKELAKEAGLSEELRPPIASVEESKAIIGEQMKAFNPPSPENIEPVIPPELEKLVAPAEQTTSTLPTPGINQPENPTPSPTVPPAPSAVNPAPITPQQPPQAPPAPQTVNPAPNPIPAPHSIPVQQPAPPAPAQPITPQQPAPTPNDPSGTAVLPEVPQI